VLQIQWVSAWLYVVPGILEPPLKYNSPKIFTGLAQKVVAWKHVLIAWTVDTLVGHDATQNPCTLSSIASNHVNADSNLATIHARRTPVVKHVEDVWFFWIMCNYRAAIPSMRWPVTSHRTLQVYAAT